MKKKNSRNTKARIVSAAWQLFYRNGYDDTTIEEIVELSGTSKGSFYHYFEKKSDILVGLFGRIDSWMEKNAFPLMKKRSEAENLRVFAQQWLKYIEDNGLEHSRLISSINATDNTVNGEKRTTVKKLEDVFRKGREHGTLSSELPPETAAAMFMIALRGLALDWTRRNAAYSLTGQGDVYIGFLIKAISAQR